MHPLTVTPLITLISAGCGGLGLVQPWTTQVFYAGEIIGHRKQVYLENVGGAI